MSVTAYTKAAIDALLAGKDAAGAASAAQAAAVQRANHTGTQSADTVTDGTTNKAYTAAEKTKLAGIAPGAVALPPGGVNGQVLGLVGGQLAWVNVTTYPGTSGLS